MATRLIGAGYHLTVYDRTRERAQAIKGATVTETPKEAVSHSDVVISIVTDDAALEEVKLGPKWRTCRDACRTCHHRHEHRFPEHLAPPLPGRKSKGRRDDRCGSIGKRAPGGTG